MAVSGFLELLKDLKISDLRTLSQSMSQNYCGLTQIYSETYGGMAAGGASHSNEGLCLEILSILREVFKHQHDVKIVLYKGTILMSWDFLKVYSRGFGSYVKII